MPPEENEQWVPSFGEEVYVSDRSSDTKDHKGKLIAYVPEMDYPYLVTGVSNNPKEAQGVSAYKYASPVRKTKDPLDGEEVIIRGKTYIIHKKSN